jgi:hypothetical protein
MARVLASAAFCGDFGIDRTLDGKIGARKPWGMRIDGVGWLGRVGLLVAVGVVAARVAAADAPDSQRALQDLRAWLRVPRGERGAVGTERFATVGLTRKDAGTAADLLWNDRLEGLRESRRAEVEARTIEQSGKKLRWEVVRFGPADAVPQGGRSLFISMHGGGGAPARVNDSQWTNQVRLARGYAPKEGIYVAPRGPTDTWNLWHEAHIDGMFARLIEDYVALESVNPNRVYLMGYSAGGDGVYQLAPRMADWWAAAAMSAGHPNETQPFGLRNVPFALQVGGQDSAYRRNQIAVEWGEKFKALRAADPGGYEHLVKVPPTKGHWMDLEDRVAIPWMEERSRQPLPTRVAWRQDDILHSRFYWLAVALDQARAGQQVAAVREGQAVRIEASDAKRLIVRWNDDMADLDQPVRVTLSDPPMTLHEGTVIRTIGMLGKTLEERGDRNLMFSGESEVVIPVP